jgi:hypothetical protein
MFKHAQYVKPQKDHISRHYLHNRSTSNTGMLGYINITEPKERSPKLWQLPTASSYSIQGNEL